MTRVRPWMVTVVVAAGWSGPARADLAANGYGMVRAQVTVPSDRSLVSTRDLAMIQLLPEANLQLKLNVLDDKLRFTSDTSAFGGFALGYSDRATGTYTLLPVADHDVPAFRPRFVISEAYGQWEVGEHLNITVGRKRVVWGTGQTVNPTDIINPPRDPSDPAFQRTGAWMLRVESPWELFTLTALVAPSVLTSNHGIPQAMLFYPPYASNETVRAPMLFPDARDTEPHFVAALRGYTLLWDTDINLWLLGSHRPSAADNLDTRPRFAASLSRTVFTSYELHFEGIVTPGSARQYAVSECVASDQAALMCIASGKSLVEQRHKDSWRMMPRFLVGTRTLLPDESILVVEYLYQHDGMKPEEFSDAMRLQQRIGNATRATAGGFNPNTSSQAGDLPVRFSFDPLRRHYLFVSWNKMQVLDDFTFLVTSITALEDLSSLLTGAIQWTPEQWLMLSVFGFLPVPGAGRISSWLPGNPLQALEDKASGRFKSWVPAGVLLDNERYGEYDATPFAGRVVTEVRVFF